MSGRVRSILGGRSSARYPAVVLAGLTALGLVASLILQAREPTQRSHSLSQTTIAGRLGGYPDTSPAQAARLAAAREAARRFLTGYLLLAYGRASASAVPATTASLSHQLRSDHVVITPVERRRHPRLGPLDAAVAASGVVVVTALVDDGGITNYAVRLTVAHRDGEWLVSRVGDG